VELLVALVCTAVLCSIMAAMLVAHGRFAALQNAREDAQQNARATLELIAAELRGIDPHAVAVAEERTITFRLPRAWGVVCHHVADRLSVLYPAVATPALLAGDDLLAIPPVARDSGWQFLPVKDAAAEAAAARAHCDAMGPGLPPGSSSATAARMYAPRDDSTFTRTLGIATGERGLPPGTPVYVHEEIRYQVALSGTAWWIRRNTGPAMAMHPLAGPVPERGGLRFVYHDSAGAILSGLGSQGARDRIRSVDVMVEMQSRAHFNGVPVRDSIGTRVTLRNPR
jgi:hypothetical protein